MSQAHRMQKMVKKTLAAHGLEELFSSCAVVSGFCSGGKSASADYHFTFYLPYYSEGMDDGQKTPPGHPDFNSYVKILRVFICSQPFCKKY
jgi:hypothetical protein